MNITQITNEAVFQAKTDKLFDIAIPRLLLKFQKIACCLFGVLIGKATWLDRKSIDCAYKKSASERVKLSQHLLWIRSSAMMMLVMKNWMLTSLQHAIVIPRRSIDFLSETFQLASNYLPITSQLPSNYLRRLKSILSTSRQTCSMLWGFTLFRPNLVSGNGIKRKMVKAFLNPGPKRQWKPIKCNWAVLIVSSWKILWRSMLSNYFRYMYLNDWAIPS